MRKALKGFLALRGCWNDLVPFPYTEITQILLASLNIATRVCQSGQKNLEVRNGDENTNCTLTTGRMKTLVNVNNETTKSWVSRL